MKLFTKMMILALLITTIFGAHTAKADEQNYADLLNDHAAWIQAAPGTVSRFLSFTLVLLENGSRGGNFGLNGYAEGRLDYNPGGASGNFFVVPSFGGTGKQYFNDRRFAPCNSSGGFILLTEPFSPTATDQIRLSLPLNYLSPDRGTVTLLTWGNARIPIQILECRNDVIYGTTLDQGKNASFLIALKRMEVSNPR